MALHLHDQYRQASICRDQSGGGVGRACILPRSHNHNRGSIDTGPWAVQGPIGAETLVMLIMVGWLPLVLLDGSGDRGGDGLVLDSLVWIRVSRVLVSSLSTEDEFLHN